MTQSEAKAIINAYNGAVVPRKDLLANLVVGRDELLKAIRQVLDDTANGGSIMKFLIGDPGFGKTCIMYLTQMASWAKGFVTMNADFTSDRRLYDSGAGKARMPYCISEAGMLCIYPFAGTRIFNTLKFLFDAQGDGYKLSMNLSKSQFLKKCRDILNSRESLLPTIREMIRRGEIPLRHRYEKYLDLNHQARLEFTLNYDYDGTLEYIKEILSQETDS